MGPGKVRLPPECAIRPRSHFTPPLENSTQGFRSATDLVTTFRPITSLTLKKVPFTAGPMHISALFQAHSSVLDLVFYDGEQFPAEYRGDAFVALKGSWNRSEPTGYKVVRVRFKDGRPDGSYENFVTGFWVSGQHRAEVWGRPAALAVMKDGSLLIADGTGGTIWRVSYTGSKDRASDRETTTGTMPR